jgi:hypothetical protein
MDVSLNALLVGLLAHAKQDASVLAALSAIAQSPSAPS